MHLDNIHFLADDKCDAVVTCALCKLLQIVYKKAKLAPGTSHLDNIHFLAGDKCGRIDPGDGWRFKDGRSAMVAL